MPPSPSRRSRRSSRHAQVCREFLVVLTRKPVEGRAFIVEEALTALDSWHVDRYEDDIRIGEMAL